MQDIACHEAIVKCMFPRGPQSSKPALRRSTPNHTNGPALQKSKIRHEFLPRLLPHFFRGLFAKIWGTSPRNPYLELTWRPHTLCIDEAPVQCYLWILYSHMIYIYIYMCYFHVHLYLKWYVHVRARMQYAFATRACMHTVSLRVSLFLSLLHVLHISNMYVCITNHEYNCTHINTTFLQELGTDNTFARTCLPAHFPE